MVKKNKIYSWLLTSTIFLAPLNLFLRWSENQAYINGLFSDYLVPKIWLAELPIVLILFLYLTELIKNKKINFSKNKLIITIIVIIFFRQLFTINKVISVISFFRTVELVGLAIFLKEKINNLDIKLVYKAFLFSFLGQIILANLQFFLQKNLFDYIFLGETQLSGAINIAKINLKNGLFISPYGSTAHPNILAGFLVITLIILLKKLDLNKNKQIYFAWILIAVTSWTLFLTQSYSAIASLFIFLLLQNFNNLKNKLSIKLLISLLLFFPILLFLINQKIFELSIARRVSLNLQSLLIWQNKTLLGTGLGNFLYYLPSSYSAEVVRFFQPVHHGLLLWLTETGLVGGSLLIILKNFFQKKNILMIVFILLPIISLDHYLLTQWLGGWLIAIMALL